MYIYNNNFKSYKIVKHTKIDTIKEKGVKATSSRQFRAKNINRLRAIKPLREKNAEFLTQLGFKVIKK